MQNIDADPFTVSELDHDIKKLKRNTAGGEDDITSEMLQSLNEDTKFALLNIMNEILLSKI